MLEGKPDRRAFLDFLRRKIEEADTGGSAMSDPPPEVEPEEPPLLEMERLLERVLRTRGY